MRHPRSADGDREGRFPTMSTDSRRHPRQLARWLGGLLAATCAVVAPAAAAAAEPVTTGDTVYIGNSIGYGGTALHPVWTETPATGDPDFLAYCIEHDVPARSDAEGVVGDLDGYLGENHFSDPTIQGKVLWVLAHSYPALSLEAFGAAAGVPGISQNDAIEATQYAIWRYTDLAWDADWPFESEDSETAYWYLVNGANASDGLTPDDLQVTVSVTGPTAEQSAGSLVWPFLISTNQERVSVASDPSTAITDASGSPIDASNVHDGDEVFLDLRGSDAAGSATVRASASGASGSGLVLSVPKRTGETPAAGEVNHAQSLILVAADTASTSAEAGVTWSGTRSEPAIRTSLVDSADGDQVLPWNGGTGVDTVAYENLTPGTEYTVTGELIDRADSTPTGITGRTTFTPTEPNGSVQVTFTVPDGYAGTTLVAFERLFEGTDTTIAPVATHEDINDLAQTVTVEDAPATPTPTASTPTASTPTASSPTAPNSTGEQLAHTGSDLAGGLLTVALLALVAGGAVLAARRHA